MEEKYRKIQGNGESFDGIPGEERKRNNGKFQRVMKILMEFLGGKVSENGYPQQGVQTISGKAQYMLYIILYRGRRILGHIS